MEITGRVTDYERAIEMLRGIFAGMTCDYKLTDAEIGTDINGYCPY